MTNYQNLSTPMLDLGVDQPIALPFSVSAESLEHFAEWNQDMRNVLAPNSIRLIHSVVRVHSAWCMARGVDVLPLTLELLTQRVEEMIQVGRSRSTIEAHLWALGMLHQAFDLPSVMQTARWRRRWQGFVRDERLNSLKQSKRGLGYTLRQKVVGAIEPER